MIEIFILISSILAVIGFFTTKTLFYIFGIVALIGFIRYMYLKTKEVDKKEIDQIIKTKKFQRRNSKKVYIAENEEELKKIIFMFKTSNMFARILVYLIVLAVLILLFNYEVFLWIGILFGLAYIIEIPYLLNKNKRLERNVRNAFKE
jgi:hypothetical protein